MSENTTPASDTTTETSSVDLAGAVEAAVTPTNPTGTPATPATPEASIHMETSTNQDTPDTDADADPDTDAGKTFTQAEVDAILKQRLGRQEKAHAKELAELKETAGMSAAEAATHKAEVLEKTNADLAAELAQVRVDYSLRIAALTAGVPADQTDAITRLADTTALTDPDTGDIDTEKVTEAVAGVLAKYPGLAGTPAAPSAAPSSDPVGSGPATADPQRKQPENLMDAVIARFGS